MPTILEKYQLAKSSKVGDNCVCPSCDSEFIKTNYQQAFCKSKQGTSCKDKYWNTVTPEKRNNTTRISPASARWLSNQQDQRDFNRRNIEDDFHPHDSYSLGQWDD